MQLINQKQKTLYKLLRSQFLNNQCREIKLLKKSKIAGKHTRQETNSCTQESRNQIDVNFSELFTKANVWLCLSKFDAAQNGCNSTLNKNLFFSLTLAELNMMILTSYPVESWQSLLQFSKLLIISKLTLLTLLKTKTR